MASTLSSYRSPIVSSTAPNSRKPDSNLRSEARSNNWWAPIFGWSSEPDYVSNLSSGAKIEPIQDRSEKTGFRGRFTEEKAKEMRKKTIETSTFHDMMYHSAIAARLASDLSEHQDR